MFSPDLLKRDNRAHSDTAKRRHSSRSSRRGVFVGALTQVSTRCSRRLINVQASQQQKLHSFHAACSFYSKGRTRDFLGPINTKSRQKTQPSLATHATALSQRSRTVYFRETRCSFAFAPSGLAFLWHWYKHTSQFRKHDIRFSLERRSFAFCSAFVSAQPLKRVGSAPQLFSLSLHATLSLHRRSKRCI